jgi:hypothetical protein
LYLNKQPRDSDPNGRSTPWRNIALDAESFKSLSKRMRKKLVFHPNFTPTDKIHLSRSNRFSLDFL